MTGLKRHQKKQIEDKAILSLSTRNTPTKQQGLKITKKGRIDNRYVSEVTVSRKTLAEFCEQQKDRSFKLWKCAIKAEATLLNYTKALLMFTLKQVNEGHISTQTAFDELLKLDQKTITVMCEDWILECIGKIHPNSVQTYFYPIELFFSQNDIEINWKRLHKMFPERVKPKNRKAYTQDDLTAVFEEMLDNRGRSLVTFLGSSSMRVGALAYLKLKHIVDYKNCKLITVYADTVDEYKTFISPEASRHFDQYLEDRKRNDENLSDESWAFVRKYTRQHKIDKTGELLEYPDIYKQIERAGHKAKVRDEQKKGATDRRDKAMIHAIRKFAESQFNNEKLHQNYINILTGHVSANLDVSTYWDIEENIDVVYQEYIKCLPRLAISNEERRKYEVKGAKSLSTEQELAYEQRIADQETKIAQLEKIVYEQLTNKMTQENTRPELYKPLSTLRD
tara:strand:+ start:56 stop:1408 length:1353 start_codon:yes stop_codon:yes gene_type:complete